MNKSNMIIVIAVLVVGGLGFYGGMKYGESSASSSIQSQQGARQFGALGSGFRGGRAGGQMGGDFVYGEVISKDDKSITVKLRDGGSRIVFLSGSAEITKSVSGSPADVEIGKTVTASGTKNSDGSMTASLVQIRPQTPQNQ